MTALPTIAGRDLPPLAYAHNSGHEPALTAPVAGWGPKPDGGLWTSPVTARDADGAPVMTAWIGYWRGELLDAGRYTHLTEITPTPDARVLLVDSLDHLRAVVGAYPTAEAGLVSAGLGDRWPDWAGIYGARWDAVYLTERGQRATHYTTPGLPCWDCATVLWLRPAYSVGRTVEAAPVTGCEVA